MPREQALFGQRPGVVAGGVEGHLDHAVDVAVRHRQAAGVQAEAAGNGRAYPVAGEDLALDLAGLHHVLGERAQGGLAAHLEAEGVHTAEQLALGVACPGQGRGEPGRVLLEVRPFGTLPDVHGSCSARVAVNVGLFSAAASSSGHGEEPALRSAQCDLPKGEQPVGTAGYGPDGSLSRLFPLFRFVRPARHALDDLGLFLHSFTPQFLRTTAAMAREPPPPCCATIRQPIR